MLLFSCSSPIQSEDSENIESPKNDSILAIIILDSLKPILQRTILSEQIEDGKKELIYKSEQKKNSSREVISSLPDIASRNNSLTNSTESSNFRYKYQNEQQPEKSYWGLRIIFDNDIWNNTDYYYTNGVAIELITPLANNSPINKILLGVKSPVIEFVGFSIQQNMYTPINPDVSEILNNDRPFSAFLTIGHFRETYNFEKKLRIKSTLDIGVLGPASLGGTIQNSIHTEEPVGWQNQIQNSFVISYSSEIEKSILQTQNFELNIKGNASVGSLFNKAGGGLWLRVGRFIPVYKGPIRLIGEPGKNNPLQFWFFAKGNTDFVLYDATLQGGLFNNDNPYIISSNKLNRFIFQASAGFAIYTGSFGIELENFYLSPEFKGGRSFGWGRIKLIAAF